MRVRWFLAVSLILAVIATACGGGAAPTPTAATGALTTPSPPTTPGVTPAASVAATPAAGGTTGATPSVAATTAATPSVAATTATTPAAGATTAATPSAGATPAATPAAGATAAGTPSAGATPASASAAQTVQFTSDPKLGKILTDGSGRTLYQFAHDKKDTSACTGGCATTWPPFSAATAPAAPTGDSGTMGTMTRPDGSKQITYNGIPLYYYVRDTKPGDTTGQGVGNLWKVVAPGDTPPAS